LILNDYFDLETDKVNAPHRPLPSGAVSPSEAVLLTILVTVLGLSAALFFGWPAVIITIFIWSVGALYNWRYKRTGLAGNLMVAACVGSTFLLGGFAVGQPFHPLVWFFSLVAFLIDLAEEIAGDAMDIEGDRLRSSKSLAIVYGRAAALRISGGLFVSLVVISLLPFLFGWTGILYLVLVSITGAITIAAALRLMRSQTPEEGRRSMRWIYLSALFAMLVFIGSQFFR
jgi:geranylgeranylglycerol-phosphate geranylgeranyltransferase